MKRLLVGFAMLLAGIGGAWGDEAYPNRPIEWVVPFGAGGGSDRWARIMSSAAIDAFGQPWNVRNVGGDQGRKGWRYILEQPADGYTVLQGSMTPSISALRDRKSGFTPYDIRIAAFISTIKTHLIAAPAAAFTDWKGLVVRTGNGAVPRIGGTSAVLLSAAARVSASSGSRPITAPSPEPAMRLMPFWQARSTSRRSQPPPHYP